MTIRRWIAFMLQPLCHELGREPVEQGGMRRPLAVAAEVVDRGHDRPAEVTAPEMVHGHPGRQRVGLDP